ncbi:MAG TPA: hypothetical protein VJ761_18750 [Ktedonobacteraceae bacterium]|nr:hypothetical protein [Ktedonobacteraceae bacterium]
MTHTRRPVLHHVTIRFFFVPLLLLSILVPTALSGMAHATANNKTPIPLSKHSWNVVPSPSPDAQYNQLLGVAALSARDVWAVGYDRNGAEALIEHWNGNSWRVIYGPSFDQGSALYGIAAVNRNDIWAVGYYGNPAMNTDQTLTEHWDGEHWSVVPSPNPDPSNLYYRLTGVAVISATDIWAVGSGSDPNGYTQETLTLHWDGTSWSVVTSPNPTTYDWLTAVTAIASNDVWAVGYGVNSSNVYRTLTLHWDGSSWNVVTSPTPGSMFDYLYGVTAISSTDVWAVGDEMNVPGSYQTLILHWDGTQWSAVPSPDPGLLSNWLYGVAGRSAKDLWAVGVQSNPNNYASQTLTLHWNGASWNVVISPNVTVYNALYCVAMLSPGNSWAVGYTQNSDFSHRYTLTEHYH